MLLKLSNLNPGQITLQQFPGDYSQGDNSQTTHWTRILTTGSQALLSPGE